MPTGLSDMEELLSKVSSKPIVDYMREALACYGAGAYRACIVLSYIAVFEDLRIKLQALGSINKEAKAASIAIDSIASNQKPFETALIHKLKAAKIISELESQRLEQITNHRNKAAHPSGLHPSAEEARFVYFESIDKFLSRELLQAGHLVAAIIDKIDQQNFFPTVSLIDIEAITREEVENLHELSYDSLITQLVALLDNDATTSGRNARMFLLGLCYNKGEPSCAIIRQKLLKDRSSDEKLIKVIVSACSANPALLAGIDGPTHLRLKKLFADRLSHAGPTESHTNTSHPANLASSIISKLGEEFATANYGSFINNTIKKFPYSTWLLGSLKSAPTIKDKVIATYVASARSQTWETANSFAENLPDIDSTLAKITTSENSLRIIAGVCHAANEWNAFRAIDLRNSKFQGTPKLKALAKEHLKSKPKSSEKILAEIGLGGTAAGFRSAYL